MTKSGKNEGCILFHPHIPELIAELEACVKAVRYAEVSYTRKGFSDHTNALCQKYIINNVIGNASNR